MELNETNYYSLEMGKEYCSVSQLKNFIGYAGNEGCEEKALAEMNGEYVRPVTDALLIGSYLDCILTEPNKLEEFKTNHPEMFSKTGATKGEIKATYRIAETMADRVKRDKIFMKALEGETQNIMVGEIFGVPFKIKMDAYKEGKYITDLKSCKSITEFYYNPLLGRRENFIEHYGYDIQGAIYQEIVRQNTGLTLPFFIAAVSKEQVPDIELIQIDNASLKEKLENLEERIRHVGRLRNGEIEPTKCGCCDWCKEHKVISKPINWLELGGVLDE